MKGRSRKRLDPLRAVLNQDFYYRLHQRTRIQLIVPAMKLNVSGKDVAIIGMSCRTAGANSPSELWEMLANSRDVQRFNLCHKIEVIYSKFGYC